MWKIVSDGTSNNTQVTYNGEIVGGVQALSIGIHAGTPLVQVSIAMVNVELDIQAPDDQVTMDSMGDVGYLREENTLTSEGRISPEMLQELVEQLAQAGYDDGITQ